MHGGFLPHFASFLVFGVFLNAGNVSRDERTVICPPFPMQDKQQFFFFVSVKGRIQGKENTGVCSGRQKGCLARQRPYGIRTKHIFHLVHLIQLHVKDTLRSMAKKYSFGHCFQTCRDFSK